MLTAVNKRNRTPNAIEGRRTGTIATLKTILAEGGVRGLFVGTKARLLHVCVIVVVQLLVYDLVKQACGVPLSGLSH